MTDNNQLGIGEDGEKRTAFLARVQGEIAKRGIIDGDAGASLKVVVCGYNVKPSVPSNIYEDAAHY